MAIQITVSLFLRTRPLWFVVGPDATATLMAGLLSLWLLFALSVLLWIARAALLLAVIGGASLLLVTLARVPLSWTRRLFLELLVARLALAR